MNNWDLFTFVRFLIKTISLLLWVFVTLGILCSCTVVDSPDYTQSGVITTNGIAAKVVSPSGDPVEGASVHYQPKQGPIIPSDSGTTYTNATGNFAVDSLSENVYLFHVLNGIVGGSMIEFVYVKDTFIDTLVMLKPLGTLILDFDTITPAKPLEVILNGDPQRYVFSPGDEFIIPNLPEYTYDMTIEEVGTGLVIEQPGVTVLSADTAIVDTLRLTPGISTTRKFESSSVSLQSSSALSSALSSSAPIVHSSSDQIVISSSSNGFQESEVFTRALNQIRTKDVDYPIGVHVGTASPEETSNQFCKDNGYEGASDFSLSLLPGATYSLLTKEGVWDATGSENVELFDEITCTGLLVL